MTKRLFVLVPAAALVSLPMVANASDNWETHKPLDGETQRLLYDPPQSHFDAIQARGGGLDTTWFGGVDGSGVAVNGGTWDFEDGTLQGWTSFDITNMDLFFRRVVSADFDTDGSEGGALNEPDLDVTIDGGTLWIGAYAREAVDLSWRAGQGYTNGMGVNAQKTFNYGGSASVTMTFDYFVDSETGFDFTYIYTVVDGDRSEPLNTSLNPDEQGFGYSGDFQDFGAAIGTPDDPEHASIVIDVSDLPGAAGPFDVLINFDSDPLYSDGLDSLPFWLNSIYGPFGMDNFSIIGTGLSESDDFNVDEEGWIFFIDPAIGNLMKVANLDDLDPISDPCACPITLDPNNDYVLIAAIIDGSDDPHPKKHNENLISAPAYIGAGSGVEDRTDRLILYNCWADLPTENGVGFRQLFAFYPWTSPATGVTGWTVEHAGDGGYAFQATPACFTGLTNNSEFLPGDVDSIKVVFEIIGDCDDFGTDDCTGPGLTNHSPYFDDVRIGLAGLSVDAPAASLDNTYQDVYPQNGTSVATNATALAVAYYDNRRADNDKTNADMGDSVVVIGGTQPNTEVYLNFRVSPGPGMDQSGFDAYMTGKGLASNSWLAPSFAKARMDTAETQASGVVPGSYSTYFHPNGQEDIANNKIIPDGFLTPGTGVEYFFSTNFTPTPAEQNIIPDTTGGFFLEFEVLPGYETFLVEGSPVDLAPCFLYVDAYNAGAQAVVEEWGLTPYLGTLIDTDGIPQDAWDRYDYSAAGSNVPAPLARESSGNNGMTQFQSMVYTHVLYNTGTNRTEGLRNGDAALLANLLTNDDFSRWDVPKGLWLSGNGMATILDNPNRPSAGNLLSNFARAAAQDNGTPYHELSGDSSFCVRLDPASGRDFPAGADSYASLRGNGCPNLLEFQILDALTGGDGEGLGNQIYVDQDGSAGGGTASFASVSNDQYGSPANYGVVIDAYSLHYLRATSDGWTGEDCDTFLTAVTDRTTDVLGWMGMPTGGAAYKSTDDLVVGVPGTPGAAGRSVLYQNTPNPFNPKTTVRYDLGGNAHVKLAIFDVSGRLVRTLVDDAQVAGSYDMVWDGISDAGTKVSSGVYWARLSTSTGFKASTKMVVLK